jgi:hypothetical protein
MYETFTDLEGGVWKVAIRNGEVILTPPGGPPAFVIPAVDAGALGRMIVAAGEAAIRQCATPPARA